MLRKLALGISAGVLIAIGGCVYLACDSKYMGAALFAVALLGICSKGYALFTGKVGYLVSDHSADALISLSLSILGNAIATISLGLVIHAAMPHLGKEKILSAMADCGLADNVRGEKLTLQDFADLAAALAKKK